VDKVTAALLLLVGVHVVAVAVLIWAIADTGRSDWRRWRPGGGDGRGPEDPGPMAPDGPGGDGLPLPDAEPAGVRLRTEHERLARARRRLRRPAREPERPREPTR
jgi:hypothetical protein